MKRLLTTGLLGLLISCDNTVSPLVTALHAASTAASVAHGVIPSLVTGGTLSEADGQTILHYTTSVRDAVRDTITILNDKNVSGALRILWIADAWKPVLPPKVVLNNLRAMQIVAAVTASVAAFLALLGQTGAEAAAHTGPVKLSRGDKAELRSIMQDLETIR